MYLSLAFNTVALVNDETKRLSLVMLPSTMLCLLLGMVAVGSHRRSGLAAVTPNMPKGYSRSRPARIALLVDAEPQNQNTAWPI